MSGIEKKQSKLFRLHQGGLFRMTGAIFSETDEKYYIVSIDLGE